MEACFECRFFLRHRELVRGSFWSDEKIEVDAIGGDCRIDPPKRTFWGSGWPYVMTGQGCGRWEPTAQAEERLARAADYAASVARERNDTGHRDRSDEQVPGNTPDQDQRP